MQKEPLLVPKTRFYYITTKSQKNCEYFAKLRNSVVGLAEKLRQDLARVPVCPSASKAEGIGGGPPLD